VIYRCEHCAPKLCVYCRVPGGFLKVWPLRAGCWGRWISLWDRSRTGRRRSLHTPKELAAILFTKAGWDASVKKTAQISDTK
jgi:hypothetical protein